MKKLALALTLFGFTANLNAGMMINQFPIPPISTGVITESAAGIAGDNVEIDGIRIQRDFTGIGDDVLFAAVRIETNYDISSPANPGTDTRHGGALFVETNAARNNQYFSFGLEDSIKAFVGASAHANAAAVSHISHVKIWNDQNITQNFPAIAWNPRMDFFNGSNENAAFSTHTFGYFIRPEFFRLNQAASGRVFGWYSPTDRSIQNVNAGNVFKVSVTDAVDGGDTLDLSQACGGRFIMTSTASITLNGTTFANTPNNTIPSSSSTGGTYNADCEVKLVNANLVGGRTITMVDTADLLPIGATLVIGALGGETEVWSYPTASVWIQSRAPSK